MSPVSRPRRAGADRAIFADQVTSAAARHLALSPAASMQDIAAAAGISRATLFRRFPSRDALIAELSSIAAEAFVAAVDDAGLDRDTPTHALERLLDALSELAAVAGLLTLQPLQLHVEQALLTRTAATEDAIRQFLRRGQESGDFRIDLDPDWFLAMLTWLSVGAADTTRLGRLTPAAAHRQLVATVTAATRRPHSADSA